MILLHVKKVLSVSVSTDTDLTDASVSTVTDFTDV